MYLHVSVVVMSLVILFSIYNLEIVNLEFKYYVKMLVVLTISIMALINYEKIVMPSIIIILVCLIYIKEKRIISAIVTSILSVIIVLLADAINSNLVTVHILKMTPKMVRESNSIFIILISNMAGFIIAYIISYTIKKLINKKINFKEITFKNKFNMFIISVIVLTFVIFYINISYFMDVQNISNTQIKLNSIMFILYFIMLVIISVAFYINVKKEMEMNHKKVELEQLKEYTRNLESLYNEMRGFRHDYINILSSMISYMDENDMEGLKKHFKNNILATSKEMEKGNFRLGHLKNIEIQEIKGVISSKLIRAQELSIETFIDIVEPIKDINMGVIDLCRVLGIIIDNAVEAASVCEKKELKLAVVNKKNSVVIVVINSCSKDIPPIHKLFEKGFSTKGEKRGIGLSNLNSIVNRYKNVSLDTFIEDDTFTQVIEIVN